MKKTKNILSISLITLTLAAIAQINTANAAQCSWWGRDTYPICATKSSGWGKENGKKCISRSTCINDQPSNRGGIIGDNGGSTPPKETSAPTPRPTSQPTSQPSPTPPTSPSNDQCNTTQQCQVIFGNQATDCKDSRSNNSVCMCGNNECSNNSGGGNNSGGNDNSSDTCTLNKKAKGIPEISLFTVKGKSTPRNKFCTLKKWYSESTNKQVFRLFKGDDMSKHVDGGRKHARTEAQHGLLFRPGNEWHEFEGDFKIEGDRPPITITVAQLFAGCCGPVARVEMKTSGRVHVGSTADGNTRISDNSDYFGKSFKIKIRSNGKRIEVYFNNSLKYSGNVRHKDALYHFRWGVYSNEIPIGNFQNTVTNVTRK